MFKSARIKLTLWYLAIIMLVTVSFSLFVYASIAQGTRLALEAQQRRLENQFPGYNERPRMPRNSPLLDAETLMVIQKNTRTTLILVNFLVFAISASLGYLLAGVTLNPIEDMMKKQKRFVSDAAHEIKTPLTAMKTVLEVSLRDKQLNLTESKRVIESTIEEVDKLHKFTNRLLQKSKYQNGDTSTDIRVDVGKILDNVIHSLQPLARKDDISISYIKKSDDGNEVLGNIEELEELLRNIVENAIKYSKRGGNVETTLSSEHNVVRVEVTDRGQGIAENDIPHIFEPFYRGDKSRTDSERKGYGLGLAISKEVVERHKGKILVESTLGSGSKFTIVLPKS